MESPGHPKEGPTSEATSSIQAGPLAGLRWITAAGPEFLQGNHEKYKTDALLEHLEPGHVFFDVGARAGYISAVASLAVGESGSVVAFEPRPAAFRFLEEHIRLNDLGNVDARPVGVADREGNRLIRPTAAERAADAGEVEIEVISIDEEVAAGNLPKPDFIKIDNGGDEIVSLQGAERTLLDARPILLVATHGPEGHEWVLEIFESYGYEPLVIEPDTAEGDVEVLGLPGPLTEEHVLHRSRLDDYPAQ